jgi:site-specific recombinase XerC
MGGLELPTWGCGSLTDARDRALLLLLMYIGVRQQELTDLTISNVDLDKGNILVRYGKGLDSNYNAVNSAAATLFKSSD